MKISDTQLMAIPELSFPKPLPNYWLGSSCISFGLQKKSLFILYDPLTGLILTPEHQQFRDVWSTNLRSYNHSRLKAVPGIAVDLKDLYNLSSTIT